MGEALLVRKGGGEKVTIDGEKVKTKLNLVSVRGDFRYPDLPLKYYSDDCCAVVRKGEIHMLGGTSSSTNHYKWNGTEWTSASTLPFSGVHKTHAVVLNNEIHLLVSTNHYKWNGTAWTSVSTLPFSIAYGCVVVLNNEVHLLGSDDSYTGTKHYKWNGTAWTSVSTLPYKFYKGCAVVLNNEIHLLGGGGSSSTTKHYKWNGTAWTSVSTLPFNIDSYYNCNAVVLNNEIHITKSGNSANPAQYYKWNGTTWTSNNTLPYEIGKGCAVVFDSKIHLLGGGDSEDDIAAKYHYVLDDEFYRKAA